MSKSVETTAREQQEAAFLQLVERCHAGSKAKGFWEPVPNSRQQLMLVVSEVAEALEADRKDRYAKPNTVNVLFDRLTWINAGSPSWTKEYIEAFTYGIKDTVEDEFADVAIRLYDFIGGYGLDAAIIAERVVYFRTQESITTPADNLGEMLLSVTGRIVDIARVEDDGADIPYHELAVADAFIALEMVAEHQAIDLPRHIDLKLAYNASRPFKHGKGY